MLTNRAIAEYSDVNVISGISTSNGIELIGLLFEGLSESLSLIKCHIVHGSIELKTKYINRANGILFGLIDALDLENGGDLAIKLQDLYLYMIKKINQVNLNNDSKSVDEIQLLLNDIHQAWKEVPFLLQENKKPNLKVIN